MGSLGYTLMNLFAKVYLGSKAVERKFGVHMRDLNFPVLYGEGKKNEICDYNSFLQCGKKVGFIDR
ncbi:hypothetical protein VFC2021_06280 [Listeria innocua]